MSNKTKIVICPRCGYEVEVDEKYNPRKGFICHFCSDELYRNNDEKTMKNCFSQRSTNDMELRNKEKERVINPIED